MTEAQRVPGITEAMQRRIAEALEQRSRDVGLPMGERLNCADVARIVRSLDLSTP